MILVNIHRLSQTIPLQSGEKSEKAAYFFMLTLHYQGVFKETHLRGGRRKNRKKKSKPVSRTPSQCQESGADLVGQLCLICGLVGTDTVATTIDISRAANDCINEFPCVESSSLLAGINTRNVPAGTKVFSALVV